MSRTSRISTVAAMVVCLGGVPGSDILFAADANAPLDRTSPAEPVSAALPAQDAAASSFLVAPASSPAHALLAFGPGGLDRFVGLGRSGGFVGFPGSVGFPGFAAPEPIGSVAQVWRNEFTVVPSESDSFAQVYRGRGRDRRDAALTAIVIGAAASIVGGAVLVYANRPECSTNPAAGGCGYGTKVVGGAVLAGGVAGMTIGALTW